MRGAEEKGLRTEGGPPRVVVVGGGRELAMVLMTVLERGDFGDVAQQSFEIKARQDMDGWPVLAVPRSSGPTYGQQRKGHGGKPRRW